LNEVPPNQRLHLTPREGAEQELTALDEQLQVPDCGII
jgi:hypothetical protein